MWGMADPTRVTDSDAESRPQSLGDFIAAQRRAAELSLRELAERAGISNPYVSQIERGLRKPSAEVLHSLAQALQVSADTLYSYAGFAPSDEARPTSVHAAVRNDPLLAEAQKRALLDVYYAFVGKPRPDDTDPAGTAGSDPVGTADGSTQAPSADRPEKGEEG